MNRVVGFLLAVSLFAPFASSADAEEIMVKGMGRSLGWLVADTTGALGFRDCGGRLFAVGDSRVEPAKRRCPKRPREMVAEGVVAAFDRHKRLLTIETHGGQPQGFYLSGNGIDALRLTALTAGQKVRLRGPVAGRATRLALDIESRKVEDYILVGSRAWGLTLTRDESKLYVANGLSDDITIIDTAKRKVIKSVPVGLVPYGILIDD